MFRLFSRRACNLACAAFLLSLFAPALARAEDAPNAAEDHGRLTVTEENDYFASDNDRNYTQGMRAAWLSGKVAGDSGWNAPFNWLSGGVLPVFDGAGAKRKYEWTVVGQSIFTPTNIHTTTPSPKDRPYAGWLYTGVSLLQDHDAGSHHTLENLELQLGVVGPMALGEQTQNDFHQFIGVNSALGWQNYQIRNEPGLILSYGRKWRFEAPAGSDVGFDFIPQAGASLGNVMTYGDIGGLIRFGKNLAADYGPSHNRPSLSGAGWFDADQLRGDWGWSIFAGTQGRAVGRNIFLDGNTWRTSPGVDKKALVADFLVGASLFWSDAVRIDFTVVQRTKEFDTQKSDYDRFGSIDLAVRF